DLHGVGSLVERRSERRDGVLDLADRRTPMSDHPKGGPHPADVGMETSSDLTSTALAPSSSAAASDAMVFSTSPIGEPRCPITQKEGLTRQTLGWRPRQI